VPRNSSGTYSLYTPGNPVVTSTVISSTWANNTLADLASAITDSLSRSGDGGMQAPLELDNGAIGAPGLTWATETTSGWYRASAGNFRFSVTATDVLTLTTGGLVAGAATGGAKGAGTINAEGLYVNNVAVSTGTGANPSASVGLTAVNGSANTFMRSDGAPALSQAIIPTWTGQHVFSATNSSGQFFINGSTQANSGIRLRTSGTDYGFLGSSEFTTGGAADGIGLGGVNLLKLNTGAAGITTRVTISNTSVTSTLPFLGQTGSAGAPTYSFTGTTNTGVYLGATSDVWMSLGGTGYPVGYRGMPSRTITTSDSTAATDNGRSILFTGAGSQTFTVDSDFGTASNMCVILNGGTGSLAIAESLSGTMTWLNGSGSLSTGSRTLAIGGIATIWMVDANNAYIWGTGVT
jgi:hypothetical protein